MSSATDQCPVPLTNVQCHWPMSSATDLIVMAESLKPAMYPPATSDSSSALSRWTNGNRPLQLRRCQTSAGIELHTSHNIRIITDPILTSASFTTYSTKGYMQTGKQQLLFSYIFNYNDGNRLPNRHCGKHCKTIEDDGNYRTPWKEIWRKKYVLSTARGRQETTAQDTAGWDKISLTFCSDA